MYTKPNTHASACICIKYFWKPMKETPEQFLYRRESEGMGVKGKIPDMLIYYFLSVCVTYSNQCFKFN